MTVSVAEDYVTQAGGPTNTCLTMDKQLMLATRKIDSTLYVIFVSEAILAKQAIWCRQRRIKVDKLED
jgi:hypothetical protein